MHPLRVKTGATVQRVLPRTCATKGTPELKLYTVSPLLALTLYGAILA